MNGIEKITARIGADTQAEIDRILQDANAQAAAIADRYRSQVQAEDADLLAKSQRAAAERELAERCPQGMGWPVVRYEAEKDVSLQCYETSWLDAPLPRPKSGVRNGVAYILMERDAPPGPHGLAVKQAVLSEIQVPLGSAAPIQIGAVRWHKRKAAAPLALG